MDRFGDLTELTSYQFSRLSNRFGERKAQAIIDGIEIRYGRAELRLPENVDLKSLAVFLNTLRRHA